MARKSGGASTATKPEEVEVEDQATEEAEETVMADEAETVEIPTVLDDEAVKSLTPEQISKMTLFQLAGLDQRHDLLNAEQSKAVADAIQAGARATVKAVRKHARSAKRGETLGAWAKYVEQVGLEILAQAESGLNKHVDRVAVCVERDENGEPKCDVRLLKSQRFGEGEKPYTVPQPETGQESPGDGEDAPATDGDETAADDSGEESPADEQEQAG